MFAQRSLSSPTTHSYMPPVLPCRPKAHLLPLGNKPFHGTPTQICSNLLALPCPLAGAWEDYLPTLSFLQPRLAFHPGQGQNPRYRHNAITALPNVAIPLVHDVSTLPPISLHLTDYLPPVLGVVPSYARLKLRAKKLLLSDWSATLATRTTLIRPQHAPILLWAWANLLREGFTRCYLGKVISRLTPHGTILTPTRPACCALRPHRPLNMPSCPAPPPPIRDPASSKGSQVWPLRLQSGPTNSCSLRWLSSSVPPPLVSLLGCPRLLPPSTPPLPTPSFNLPPSPPLALETS